MERNLLTYWLDIDMEQEDLGLSAIALVDDPAVKRDFLCFNEAEPVTLKLGSDNTRHIITGVVCMANTKIYRNSEKFGEHYITFPKETIEKMMVKFSKDGKSNLVNLQHDDEQYINSAIMFESYIKDSERGIVPLEFKDVPDGSWIVSYKILDDGLWNEIVTGNKLNGYSLEGDFVYKQSFSNQEPQPQPQSYDEFIEELLK